MRILLINQFYKPDTAATGQLLADVAEGLVEAGHEVHVVCSRGKYGGDSLDVPSREMMDGVFVRRVSGTCFGRVKLVGRLVDYAFFYVAAAWQAFRVERPDVCICLTTPPFISLIGMLLSKCRGTRNVIWLMDMYPEVAVAYDVLSRESLLYRVLAWMNRRLYVNAAAIISLGETMTERLEGLGAPAGKLYTVHNWVPGE